MAIIYTYPQINSSSDLAASDLMIISDMSANGRPTKSLKLSDLATFITNTGTGSGTTNKITKWTDGASGLLGDSSITDVGNQVSMSTDFIINSNGGNNAKFITDWGDHRVSILDALGAYTFTAADLDGGGKIGVNKQFPSTTLHVGGTGTFDSSLSIPLIPTANAHATSKQYVDQQIASIPAGLVFQGNWNANTNTPTLASGTGTVGNYYVVSVAGNTNLDGITDWEVGDWAVFVEVGGVDKWDKIDQTFVQGAGATGQVSFWNGVNSVTGDNDLYWDNSNKRLGIGTTSPDSLLEISSGTTTDFLKLTSTGSNASPSKIIFEKSATEQGIVEYVRNGDLRIYNTDADGGVLIDGSSASGNDLYVKNDGKVGIGTNNPSSKLTVLGSTKLEGTGNKIFFGGNNTFVGENSNSNELILRGGGSTTSQSVYIDTSGNVGIGTSNPSVDLEIGTSGSADTEFLMQSDQAGKYFKVSSSGNFTELKSVGDQNLFLNSAGAGGYVSFLAGNSERMRVNYNGNVGIGTTSPDRKLEVESTGAGEMCITGATGSRLYFRPTTSYSPGGNFGILVTGSGGPSYLSTMEITGYNNGVNTVMTLKGDGNVGIGTTSPAYKLDVSGSLRATGESTFTNNLLFPDNSRIKLGTGEDLQIYHDSTNSYINNATGNLNIIQNADDKDIGFYCDDGSGGITEYFRVDGSATTVAFSQTITQVDNKYIGLGNSFDFHLQHNGTNSVITNSTGNLEIRQNADDADIIFYNDDGSGGTTEYFRLDGGDEQIKASKNLKFFDDIQAWFGDGNDLRIFHETGSTSKIENYTGNLVIQQRADDSDIVFQCDDGSGGLTEYIRIDGGTVRTEFSKTTRHIDNIPVQLGNGGDFQMYHNGSHTYLINGTGDIEIINNTNDGDIQFFSDDGSGSTTEYFRLDGGNVNIITSVNNVFVDNKKAAFGDSADLQIYHDGSDSYINETGTGDLIVKAVDDVYIRGNTHDMGRFNEQGVKFYYLGNVKLETNNTGVKIPTAGNGLQLVSPNGTVYTVTVDNSGNLVVT